MGLEIVELGIMIEEEFGIRIEDADYERLKTVGDVEQYVNCKLGRARTGGWPDYDVALVRSFCEIRREIMRQTGIPRSHLRPSTRLEEHWHCQEGWNSAGLSLDSVLTVPLPKWIIGACLGAIFAPFAAIGLLTIGLDGLLMVAAAPALLYWAASPAVGVQKSQDKSRSADLAGLARQACYPLSRLRGGDPPTRSRGGDVMPRLVEMISEGFSVPKDEIRPDSRFIEDLNMG